MKLDNISTESAKRALRAVLDLHPVEWAMGGELDICPRCVETEGANYPCATVRAISEALEGPEDPCCGSPACLPRCSGGYGR